MKRMGYVLLICAVFSIVMPAQVSAALQLQQIGGEAVENTLTAHSTAKTNPEFKGTTDPSGTVTITIDGKQSLAQADANGSWLYGPFDMDTSGVYQVSIASGGDTISFPLTITGDSGTQGATNAATTQPTTTPQPDLPDTLPQTGASDMIVLLGMGLFFITTGIFSRYVVAELFADHE